MRIALVYDWLDKLGGAERVLLALHEIWPSAPIFTTIYDPQKASWAKCFQIHTSFLNSLSFISKRRETFPFLAPFAFESFSFDEFDVVLSITSNDAKAIITKPNTFHICYCLTPTRYLWSGFYDYLAEPGVGIFNPIARFSMRFFLSKFRQWDFISSHRPDMYLAISKNVKRRIGKYYRADAKIIYPPVEIDKFTPIASQGGIHKYFLIVSRLVPYKKIDYAVTAFNKLGLNLKIIGTGIDLKRLKKLACKNIDFIGGNLTDEKLCWYYQNCQALIFPGEEDFGIAAVEAQACGKPVIGYKEGGIGEIVIPEKTGELYEARSDETLISILEKFKPNRYLATNCRKNAIRFSKKRFQKDIKKTVENCWNEWIKKA